jgi:pimeloyl-ACP methyl ester carboxylesterase
MVPLLGKKAKRHKAILLAVFIFLVAACVAFNPEVKADEQSSSDGGMTWPVPPSDEECKEKPTHCVIYQSDQLPLKERSPLLLIHGGGSEYKELFHWDKVVARFNQDERFQSKYKVYLLRYDSTRLLEDIMPEVKGQMLELARSCRNPLTIMALSMGGNIAQLAAEDSELDRVIARVIAMGTPFHGSPLFSADWFQYSLYKSKVLPLFRVLDSIDYRVYFSWHKNYQQDLKWDDADDLVPQVGAFKSKFPFGPKGVLTIGRDTSSILSEANSEHKVDKKKFTVLAGYLLNTYVLSRERDRLRYRIMAPFHFLSTQLRAQIGEENAALLVLNREISKIDTGPGGEELGRGAHVYALNDGITPISSALYLPEKVCRTHLLLRETDLQGIAPLIDVASARAFRNIDHVTFIEGKPPHHGKLVRDSLHPEQGMHEIFDWMLAEVLQCNVNDVEHSAEVKVLPGGASPAPPG